MYFITFVVCIDCLRAAVFRQWIARSDNQTTPKRRLKSIEKPRFLCKNSKQELLV